MKRREVVQWLCPAAAGRDDRAQYEALLRCRDYLGPPGDAAGVPPGGEQFDAKVTVLGEYIKHHVKEEQSEMFPKVRKADLDLKELGASMAARKAELQWE